jgi:hypothetical protein
VRVTERGRVTRFVPSQEGGFAGIGPGVVLVTALVLLLGFLRF